MKNYFFISIVLVTGILLTVGCKKEKEASTSITANTVSFDSIAAKKAIQDEGTIFMDLMAKGDSIGLANCYTADAKVLPPHGKAIVGRANIQKEFGIMIRSGMPKFDIKTIAVWGNDSMITAEEQWTFTDKNGKIVDQGKSLELWKMDEGRWKLFRDSYNSDMPVQMPK